MKENLITIDQETIDLVYKDLKREISNAKNKAYSVINTILIEENFNIGKYLFNLLNEFKDRFYGNKIIKEVSKKLESELGKGYSYRNLYLCLSFYKTYNILQAVPAKLSWTHIVELISIENKEEREFYQKEAIIESWSYRELRRQIKSNLYQRFVTAPNKNALVNIEGKLETFNPSDLVKDPYVLEFIGKSKDEKDLEKRLIERLKKFMLECGKGFLFQGEQYKIKIGNTFYYIDLVFYNRFTRSYVLMDLKTRKIKPQDVGQIELYVKYFDKYIKLNEENFTIGIIIGANKDKEMIDLMLSDKNNIFASTYLTYLPSKEEIEKIIKDDIKN